MSDFSFAAADRVLVKICGTTSIADAQIAQNANADFLGVIVEHAPSPRSVNRATARAIFAATNLQTVAVTVNKTLEELLQLHGELQPAVLQLHGDESVEIARALSTRSVRFWAACSGETDVAKMRALQMSDAGAEAVLLDARTQHDGVVTYGGTGLRSDWQLARELVERGLRVVLAGGLTPENVREAIQTVRPWTVDVLSGVELRKGVKDKHRVLDFVRNAGSVIGTETTERYPQ